MLEFVKLALANRSISELIHLARWVKFNPRFNPGLALIGVCGTQFNRGLNFNPGLGDFNPGLALIEVLRNRPLAADHSTVSIQDSGQTLSCGFLVDRCDFDALESAFNRV